MTIRRQADNLIRVLGIMLATFLATAMAWFQLGNDIQQSGQKSQNIIYMQQSYRKEAVILTCWERAGLFTADHPMRATRHVIPPPQFREQLFNLTEFDHMVEQEQCKINTDPQDVAIALHEVLHIEQPTRAPKGRRFVAKVP